MVVTGLAHAPSQLSYPERFERALEFYQNWPAHAQQPRDDTKLILYGLKQQVAHGPCQDPQPSSWSQVESAKWTAWTGLKNMDKMEAMRLFVKLLEEDEPNWYGLMTEAAPAPQRASTGSTLHSLPADNTWRTPWISADKLPYPRFEHSCCVLGSHMYLIGGNCAGGRYLADVWQLDLDTLAWSNITATYEADESDEDPTPPTQPSAAAVALPHRGRVLLVGGHTKLKDSQAPLPVRVLDPVCRSRSVLQCTGKPVPRTRGSHAACIVGDCVYVVGGESPSRKLQSSLLMLDLRSNVWSEVVAEGSSKGPPPCSSPVCAAYQDRYVLVFGGGAVGQCSNATWCFDTATSEWHQPQVTGELPAARAGCCAALVGSRWYVLGGGNNRAGCPDMWVLDLAGLGVEALQWRKVCAFDANSALASEGGTAVFVPSAGALVAFGGYNGTYHNAVSVFKPADAQEGTPGKEAAVDSAADTVPQVDEPEIQPAMPPAQQGNDRQHASENGRASHHAGVVEDSANGASAQQSAPHELAQLQKQLAAAEEARDEAEAELKEVRAALAAEKDRAFRAEVQVSELQAKLQTMDELERELAQYKEADAEKGGAKKSGIWGFISGA